MIEENKRAFFSRIESPYQATLMIQDAANAIYCVAGVQFVSALLGNKHLWLCGVLYAACGFAIRKRRSQSAAILVVAIAIGTSMVAAFTQSLTVGSLIFGLLAIWAGLRSFEAIRRLRNGFLSA